MLLVECMSHYIKGKEGSGGWRKGCITPIFQKGSRKVSTNYRGITVTNSVSRFYGRILKSRLEYELGHISEEQARFRVGRSCTDEMLIYPSMLIEESKSDIYNCSKANKKKL